MLVNAHAVKNMPGRKSDVCDAAWLADLGAHGLVRASLVPPPPIRQLRHLTRARTVISRERTREAQRLEKLLEDAGIKKPKGHCQLEQSVGDFRRFASAIHQVACDV
jgi:transposase